MTDPRPKDYRTGFLIIIAGLLAVVYFGPGTISLTRGGFDDESLGSLAPRSVAPTPECPGDSSVVLLEPMCNAFPHIRNEDRVAARCTATVLRLQHRHVLFETSPHAARVCLPQIELVADPLGQAVLRSGKWKDCELLFAVIVSVFDGKLIAQPGRAAVWDLGSHIGACAIPLAAAGFEVIAVEDSQVEYENLLGSRAVSRITSERLVIARNLSHALGVYQQRPAKRLVIAKIDVGDDDVLALLRATLDAAKHMPHMSIIGLHIEVGLQNPTLLTKVLGILREHPDRFRDTQCFVLGPSASTYRPVSCEHLRFGVANTTSVHVCSAAHMKLVPYFTEKT